MDGSPGLTDETKLQATDDSERSHGVAGERFVLTEENRRESYYEPQDALKYESRSTKGTGKTMGFLRKTTTHESRSSTAGAPRKSCFDSLNEDQIQRHLKTARYGSFLLSDAVRPSFNLEVVPSAGYRAEVYQDKETGVDIPVIMAAQSKESIMDLFIELLEPLGDEVDVVLETSHNQNGDKHQDLHRESIDLPVLRSILYDYEDLLVNDGCTGIAVLNPHIPLEVQFEEHKLIIMYGQDTEAFVDILERDGVQHRDGIRFITEAEHVHSTSEEYIRRFEELKYHLGIER